MVILSELPFAKSKYLIYFNKSTLSGAVSSGYISVVSVQAMNVSLEKLIVKRSLMTNTGLKLAPKAKRGSNIKFKYEKCKLVNVQLILSTRKINN
jgi:hypothetical protein